MTNDDIIKAAENIIKSRVMVWPDDEWIGFWVDGNEFDLNLWMDCDEIRHGSIYDVVKGETQPDYWIDVPRPVLDLHPYFCACGCGADIPAPPEGCVGYNRVCGACKEEL